MMSALIFQVCTFVTCAAYSSDHYLTLYSPKPQQSVRPLVNDNEANDHKSLKLDTQRESSTEI